MEDGQVRFSAKLKAVTVKDNGTVVQLEPDGYVTPEDIADLYRMRGKTVAVALVDPDQPLPLEYEEEPEGYDVAPAPDDGWLALP